jgi:hypothetical protein
MEELGERSEQRVERTTVAAQESADERCAGRFAGAQHHGGRVSVGEAGGDSGGLQIAPAGHGIGVAVRKDEDITGREENRLAADQPGIAVAAGQNVVGNEMFGTRQDLWR